MKKQKNGTQYFLFSELITILTIILLGCNGNEVAQTKPVSEIGQIETCLRLQLPDYFEAYETMDQVLIDYELVDGSKDSYAELYRTIFEQEYNGITLDSTSKKKLSFVQGLGPLAIIHSCAHIAKKDETLTKLQRKYFAKFHEAGYIGSIPLEQLATLIEQMTQEEFETNAVKKTTVFYLGHYFIWNHLFTLRD